MYEPQIIHTPQGEEMVVLPRKEYIRLTRLAYRDDTNDTALALEQIKKIAAKKTQLIPSEIVEAIIIDGQHPIKAWRQQKGMTSQALAQKAGLARTTISQIETGKRKGTLEAHKAIAKALDVPLSSLLEI